MGTSTRTRRLNGVLVAFKNSAISQRLYGRRAEHPTRTGTTSASSTSASATRDVRNKFEKPKSRSLQRRNSDEGPNRRNLTREFEAAAEDCTRMEDEELMPDPPPAQVQEATPQAPQPPPLQHLPREAIAEDFLGRMNIMLDNKVGQLSTEVADAMGHLEILA